MLLNPAAASCFRVPGKSLAIISRTGQVLQPIGSPSGSACSFNAPAETKPTAAAEVVAALQNSLLEIADMEASCVDSRQLQFPSLATFWANVFLCEVGVVCLQIRMIPGKLQPGKDRHIPE